MTIVELATFSLLTQHMTPYSPFVRQGYFQYTEYASYWTDIFGAPNDIQPLLVTVNAFIYNYLTRYLEQLSVADSISQGESWYWDQGTQQLTVHFGHAESPVSGVCEVGRVRGYTDENLIYIDGIEYLPLLQSFPSLAQQQDFWDAKKLALMTGSIELANTQIGKNMPGPFDVFLTNQIKGNDVAIGYLASGKSDYTRSEITFINSFYVEDYECSLTKFRVDIQDYRAAQDLMICTAKYNKTDYPYLDDDDEGKEIPLMYGQVRRSDALCVNPIQKSGPVEYRQALILTALGTVEVKTGDVWQVVTPSTIDLASGSFTLSEGDGRSDEEPLDCRVTGSTGIAVQYISDIIIDMNSRYLNLTYNASNYNTSEWEVEQLLLDEPCGVLFDKQVTLYEAIRIIQQGANIPFRYEINNGKRTIRCWWNATAATNVHREDILEQSDFSVKSDSKQQAAKIVWKYAKDYSSGTFRAIENNDNYDYAAQNYRQVEKTIEVESILTDMARNAYWAAQRAIFYRQVPQIIEMTFRGESFLTARIWDWFDMAVRPDEYDFTLGDTETPARPFAGLQELQVLSVSPDIAKKQNKMKLMLMPY